MAKKKSKVIKAKKPAKTKAKSKPKIKKGLELINLKVSGKDRRLLNLMAKKHAGGNLSAWLRHAGMKYKPAKSEVIR